jgi:hypothetical protein
LRSWSHDEQNDKQLLSRGPRPRGAAGFGSRRRATSSPSTAACEKSFSMRTCSSISISPPAHQRLGHHRLQHLEATLLARIQNAGHICRYTHRLEGRNMSTPPVGAITMYDYDLNYVASVINEIASSPVLMLPANAVDHIGAHFIFARAH